MLTIVRSFLQLLIPWLGILIALGYFIQINCFAVLTHIQKQGKNFTSFEFRSSATGDQASSLELGAFLSHFFSLFLLPHAC